MTETGNVIKSSKDYITVRFQRKTECAKCKMCAFSDNMTYFDMKFKNTVNAAEGDIVTVEMQGGAVVLSSFLVYIIPLLFAAAGLIAGYLLWGDGAAAICAAVSLAIGFFALSLIDKYLKKRNKIKTPSLTGIVNKEETNI